MKNLRFFLLGNTLLVGCLLGAMTWVRGQMITPDDTRAAISLLEERRAAIRNTATPDWQQVDQLLSLGLWEQADSLMHRGERSAGWEWRQVEIRSAYLNSDFDQASQILQNALPVTGTDSLSFAYWEIKLLFESWELDCAENRIDSLMAVMPYSKELLLLRGRLLLLRRDYEQAAQIAAKLNSTWPDWAPGYLLMGEAQLWLEDLDAAEHALKACLERDPLLADGRFYYGYVIWRGRDASRLGEMAAQWSIALELNPLHYLTHWHWGNGHTHLTFADYLDPDEAKILETLKPADSLIASNLIPEGIRYADSVRRIFPESVIPWMLIGSAHYMNFDKGIPRLDAAEKTFRSILTQKPNFGPAHNGLAAVIRARRLTFLSTYDSLQLVVDRSYPLDSAAFYTIFPDASYYPGKTVSQMIAAQLYTGTAYFPMLQRMKRQFVIPPLHVDLARAMKNTYFRNATTFDNRQWMDIRGVGSGAAGIEYVIRGAFLERNVLLYEYVHLFHGSVFTESELRRVRALYYQAMAEGRTLDYYSRNNEFEYLAQTFPAYFETVKVHPLNHKSLNTRGDLLRKDPDLYGFLDSLVNKHQAFLAGDTAVMNTNWAQVYVSLSEKIGGKRPELMRAYLDTALQYEPYLPAFRARARLEMKQGKDEEAMRWASRALQMAPRNAGNQVLMAEMYMKDGSKAALVETCFKKAWEVETDLMDRAEINQNWREWTWGECQMAEALEIAQQLDQDPAVSTYLQDRHDAAEAFNWKLKSNWGYRPEAIKFYRELCRKKPQQYEFAQTYVRLLMDAKLWDLAYTEILKRQRILNASGEKTPVLDLLMANCLLGQGRVDTVALLMPALKKQRLGLKSWQDKLDYAELIMAVEGAGAADAWLFKLRPENRRESADLLYMQSMLMEAAGRKQKAFRLKTKALEINPWLLRCRVDLMNRTIKKKDERGLTILLSFIKDNELLPGNELKQLIEYLYRRSKI